MTEPARTCVQCRWPLARDGRCSRCGWQLGSPASPQGPWWVCSRCKTTAPNPMPNFCPNCGLDMRWPSDERAEAGDGAPREQAGTSEVRWLARLIILGLIVIGLLFLLNNTHEGLVIKCRILGDLGACFLSS